jgi:hypothetical protein
MVRAENGDFEVCQIKGALSLCIYQKGIKYNTAYFTEVDADKILESLSNSDEYFILESSGEYIEIVNKPSELFICISDNRSLIFSEDGKNEIINEIYKYLNNL